MSDTDDELVLAEEVLVTSDNILDELVEEDVKAEVPDWVTHPGRAWLDDAACRRLLLAADGSVNKDAIMRFFVAAGHIISPEQRDMCRRCPVRRECLIHAYIGNQGDMVPAGYYAGFSFGQRRNTSFEDLYNIVESESARFRR